MCISTRERMLAHEFAWSKTTINIQKWRKKYLFHHACERHTRGLRRKMKKKVCWSAIGSDSQKLVDTQKLVAHLEFCCFLIVFLHGLIMLMNKTKSFLNVFYRFQPCERMRKHAFAGRNTQHTHTLSLSFSLHFETALSFRL